MTYKFPPMPNAYFDVNKWFTTTFKKNRITGQTIGYKFNYEEHLNLFLHAKFVIDETDVKVVNAFGENISVIPISVYKRFVSRGEWDDPTYTVNERKLAWKIECLSNKSPEKSSDGKIDVHEKMNNHTDPSEKKNYEIDSENESDCDSDFDFGFYDYNDSDDNIQSVIENCNVSSNLRNALLGNNSKPQTPQTKTERNSYDWIPPTFPGLHNSEPLIKRGANV